MTGLHIIQAPFGRFIFVGRVPASLGSEVPADRSAVMGGRAFRNARGAAVMIKFPSFETRDDAAAFAESKLVKADL